MRRISIDEIGSLEKGCFILVRWLDASDIRCGLKEHQDNPEVHCKDWGLYLGCIGRKRRLMLLGKDVVERHNDWGATRIPVELVEDIWDVLPRGEMLRVVEEIGVLGRRVKLRRYNRQRKRTSIVM